MSEGRQGNGFDEELPVFMDLVSHDILNINQAVLSGIELMITSSRADETAKRHARRLESQIRVSTQIFESMKMLCVLRKVDMMPSERVDLNETAKEAVSEILVMFGDRKIGIDLDECGERPVVLGGPVTKDVLVNAIMGVLQLDNSEYPKVSMGVSRDESDDSRPWVVSLRDENVTIPPSLGFETVGAISSEKRTKMVRLAGLILARMLSEKLGGAFEAAPAGRANEIRIRFSGAE